MGRQALTVKLNVTHVVDTSKSTLLQENRETNPRAAAAAFIEGMTPSIVPQHQYQPPHAGASLSAAPLGRRLQSRVHPERYFSLEYRQGGNGGMRDYNACVALLSL